MKATHPFEVVLSRETKYMRICREIILSCFILRIVKLCSLRGVNQVFVFQLILGLIYCGIMEKKELFELRMMYTCSS